MLCINRTRCTGKGSGGIGVRHDLLRSTWPDMRAELVCHFQFFLWWAALLPVDCRRRCQEQLHTNRRAVLRKVAAAGRSPCKSVCAVLVWVGWGCCGCSYVYLCVHLCALTAPGWMWGACLRVCAVLHRRADVGDSVAAWVQLAVSCRDHADHAHRAWVGPALGARSVPAPGLDLIMHACIGCIAATVHGP